MIIVPKPDMSRLLGLDWESDDEYEILWLAEDMFSMGVNTDFQQALEDMWLLFDAVPDLSGGGYEIS